LLAGGKQVTAITRTESTSSTTFPSGVTVKQTDFSHDSLVEALKDHQILIITLSVFAPRDLQSRLITAASAAGVEWIIPNRWGVNGSDPRIAQDLSMIYNANAQVDKQLHELNLSSITLVCGFWYEWSLGGGPNKYGFDLTNKKVILFDNGDAKVNTSTWDLCGRAIANLLQLPITSDGGSGPCLSDYKNKNVYISSFYLSQKDMLESVKRVTGEEFEITHESTEKRVQDGKKAFGAGDVQGWVKLLYSRYFYPDNVGDHQTTHGLQNEVLGLTEKEDLDENTRKAIQFAKDNPELTGV